MVVLCGSGNNGGDGYVVANCAQSIGIDVIVLQSSDPGTESAIEVCKEFLQNNGRVGAFDPAIIQNAGIIVDGLFGTGLNRAPSGVYAEFIEAANQAPCPVISLDIPSGLNSDTGNAFEPCIDATMTVTFIAHKIGMFTGQGKNLCGQIKFESLNLPPEVQGSVTPLATIIRPPSFPLRNPDSHKGSYGNIVIAGGNRGMLGATLLAGQAALRCGCGMVTILSTKKHIDLPALVCPELMSQHIENKSGLDRLCERCDVIVLGPGLGQSGWSEKVFDLVLDLDLPMVIDADGLNWLARKPVQRNNWILTPHPGEAGRLLGWTTAEVQRDRLRAVKAVTDQYGGVCILKGAGTLVASSVGHIALCDRGNAGMATAGMGDVLSGMLGSLLGQQSVNQLSDIQVAEAGVWLHGTCADNAAKKLGMPSLLASDVIDRLPDVMSDEKLAQEKQAEKLF